MHHASTTAVYFNKSQLFIFHLSQSKVYPGCFKEPPATSNDSEKNLLTRNNPEQDLAATERGILGHNNYKKTITDGDCEELLRVQEELNIKTLMKLNALVFLVKLVLFFLRRSQNVSIKTNRSKMQKHCHSLLSVNRKIFHILHTPQSLHQRV